MITKSINTSNNIKQGNESRLATIKVNKPEVSTLALKQYNNGRLCLFLNVCLHQSCFGRLIKYR